MQADSPALTLYRAVFQSGFDSGYTGRRRLVPERHARRAQTWLYAYDKGTVARIREREEEEAREGAWNAMCAELQKLILAQRYEPAPEAAVDAH